MSLSFTVYRKDGSLRERDEGHELKATTDKAARTEAKKYADEQGWQNYGIEFFRSSDSCRAELEL